MKYDTNRGVMVTPSEPMRKASPGDVLTATASARPLLRRETMDPELARFSPGLRKRFHVHYEEEARYQRHCLAIAIVCGVGACAYLGAMVWL